MTSENSSISVKQSVLSPLKLSVNLVHSLHYVPSTWVVLPDLLALADVPTRPRLVFVPMVESAAEMHIAAAVLADPAVGLVPLIETVAGLEAAGAIAAHPAVVMVMTTL